MMITPLPPDNDTNVPQREPRAFDSPSQRLRSAATPPPTIHFAISKDLQAVVDVFIHPLQENGKIITKDEMAEIFNNWETLFGLSTKLLDDLEKVRILA